MGFERHRRTDPEPEFPPFRPSSKKTSHRHRRTYTRPAPEVTTTRTETPHPPSRALRREQQHLSRTCYTAEVVEPKPRTRAPESDVRAPIPTNFRDQHLRSEARANCRTSRDCYRRDWRQSSPYHRNEGWRESSSICPLFVAEVESVQFVVSPQTASDRAYE